MMNLNGWVETSTKLAQTTPERRNKTYITQRRRAKKRRIFRRENTWAFDKPVKQDWNTSGKFLAWLHKSKERQNTHRTQQLPVLLWGGSRDREGTCSRKADIRHSKDSCLEEQKKKLKSRLGWTCTWALRRAGIRTTRGKGATYYWWITRCKLGEKEKETREASGHSWHPFSGTHGWCDSTDLQADGPLQILFFYHLPHNSGLIPEVSNPPKVETKEGSWVLTTPLLGLGLFWPLQSTHIQWTSREVKWRLKLYQRFCQPSPHARKVVLKERHSRSAGAIWGLPAEVLPVPGCFSSTSPNPEVILTLKHVTQID